MDTWTRDFCAGAILDIVDMIAESMKEAENYQDVATDIHARMHVSGVLSGMDRSGLLSGSLLIHGKSELVGFMLVHVGSPWYEARVMANEMFLYIKPEHRSFKAARQLVEHAISAVKAKGAVKLYAGSSIGYDDAGVRLLYKRLGFVEKSGRLEKLLIV